MGALAGAIRHELVNVPSVGLEAVGPRAQLKALKAEWVGQGGLQAKFLNMFFGGDTRIHCWLNSFTLLVEQFYLFFFNFLVLGVGLLYIPHFLVREQMRFYVGCVPCVLLARCDFALWLPKSENS